MPFQDTFHQFMLATARLRTHRIDTARYANKSDFPWRHRTYHAIQYGRSARQLDRVYSPPFVILGIYCM